MTNVEMETSQDSGPQESNEPLAQENASLSLENDSIRQELEALKAQQKFDTLTRENIALKQELEALKALRLAQRPTPTNPVETVVIASTSDGQCKGKGILGAGPSNGPRRALMHPWMSLGR